MLVAAVVVDLAANLAAWPSRAVNVHVGGPGTNRPDQLIKFAGANTSLIRQVSDVSRRDGA